jgi:hypothetical protein
MVRNAPVLPIPALDAEKKRKKKNSSIKKRKRDEKKKKPSLANLQ